MCHDEKCTRRPTIVEIYDCERETFRLSVCLLCGTDRDPLKAVLGPEAGRTTDLFCLDGAADNCDPLKEVNEDDDDDDDTRTFLN